MGNAICSFPDCDKRVLTRGLCAGHRKQEREGLSLTSLPPRRSHRRVHGEAKPCSVAECGKAAVARGFCDAHHKRLMRHGDPLVVLRRQGVDGIPEEAAFFARVEPRGDCWRWTGMKDGTGYGRFQGQPAHRWAYEFLRAPIPAGLYLDHLCRNRWCVNPWHAEPVTNHVNILRGVSPTAINARKTHCLRGHEFTPENTRPYGPNGTWRACRTCARQQNRAAN